MTTLLVQGLQDNLPVIFEIDPFSGQIVSWINIDADLLILDHIKTGGLYMQNHERGLKTYYSAFLFDLRLQIYRFSSDGQYASVDWSYEILNTHMEEQVPPMLDFMFSDPTNNEIIWSTGVYDSYAVILSFNKQVGNINSYVRFNEMTKLSGFTHAEEDLFYLCGYTDRRYPHQASVLRMDYDGTVYWYK